MFCRRLWALVSIERQWADNEHTVIGEQFHERVHDGAVREWRNGILTMRNLSVTSRRLGLTGRCDAVEFHPDDDGVPIHGEKGLFSVYPVEYKKGRPQGDGAAEAQLCAEAMCLEEMLDCEIPEGSLYYGASGHRKPVTFDEALRKNVEAICAEMHVYCERGYIPDVKARDNCTGCSMRDLCLPQMLKKRLDVNRYIKEAVDEL